MEEMVATVEREGGRCKQKRSLSRVVWLYLRMIAGEHDARRAPRLSQRSTDALAL